MFGGGVARVVTAPDASFALPADPDSGAQWIQTHVEHNRAVGLGTSLIVGGVIALGVGGGLLLGVRERFASAT